MKIFNVSPFEPKTFKLAILCLMYFETTIFVIIGKVLCLIFTFLLS